MGNPKGVMLSHDNLSFNAKAIGERLPNMVTGNETLISFLPLSHIAAQVCELNIKIDHWKMNWNKRNCSAGYATALPNKTWRKRYANSKYPICRSLVLQASISALLACLG